MDKVDEFNAADALADMAEHEKGKEAEKMDPGLYDKRHNVKFPVKVNTMQTLTGIFIMSFSFHILVFSPTVIKDIITK